jgi:hypothetical protein
VSDKHWKSYEEVAQYLLNRFANHFGVGRFEEKQLVPGESGTSWEIDAKGCSDANQRVLVVECKRHTKSGIPQAIAGALAFTIQDVDAEGGILVSPLGLQAGAKKVASKANIVEVVLNENSTTTDYVMKFLDQIHFGDSAMLSVTDHLVIEVRDQHGNVVERREC